MASVTNVLFTAFDNHSGIIPMNFIVVYASLLPMAILMVRIFESGTVWLRDSLIFVRQIGSLVALFKITSMLDLPDLYQLQTQVGTTNSLMKKGTSLLRHPNLDRSARKLKIFNTITLVRT